MYEINGKFTDGEMWALLHALDELVNSGKLTEEQWECVEAARIKLLDVIE